MKGWKPRRVFCYRCGRYGYLDYGWAESRYYPKHGTYWLSSRLNHLVEGTRLKGEPENAFLGMEEKVDNRSYYKEVYGRYRIRYIRHYSSEYYEKQMEKYRNHEIKSRPNGQKRCYIHKNVRYRGGYPYVGAYCDWPRGRYAMLTTLT